MVKVWKPKTPKAPKAQRNLFKVTISCFRTVCQDSGKWCNIFVSIKDAVDFITELVHPHGPYDPGMVVLKMKIQRYWWNGTTYVYNSQYKPNGEYAHMRGKMSIDCLNCEVAKKNIKETKKKFLADVRTVLKESDDIHV
jgi:hypothetical protein